jgi:hypothetical protein
LIGTVNPGFDGELFKKIGEVLNLVKIDYVRGKPQKEYFEKAANLGKLVAQKVKEIVKIS